MMGGYSCAPGFFFCIIHNVSLNPCLLDYRRIDCSNQTRDSTEGMCHNRHCTPTQVPSSKLQPSLHLALVCTKERVLVLSVVTGTNCIRRTPFLTCARARRRQSWGWRRSGKENFQTLLYSQIGWPLITCGVVLIGSTKCTFVQVKGRIVCFIWNLVCHLLPI